MSTSTSTKVQPESAKLSDSSTAPVRTRIAPSPTGIAHVGTAYMALFNSVFAKKYGGQFLVRIEDTDRTRFVEGAEQVIYDALDWLGIHPDESVPAGGPYAPYRQSECLPLYKKHAEELIAKGHAYYCFCSSEDLDAMRKQQQKEGHVPMYDGRCLKIDPAVAKERAKSEKHVVRLHMPDTGKTSWVDAIRGKVEFENALLDDQVLLKSDGFPTYHLAVVVDDNRMKITHVMRGEEWISSTPKHIVLYTLFGWPIPVYAHMPLLRNADKSKLSKRKNDVSIMSYKQKGYLPEALLNYLCLMGWSHPEKKDIFDVADFMQHFSLERMQTTGPIFDFTKLQWMNGVYIREKFTQEQIIERILPYLPADYPVQRLAEFLPLVRERLVLLTDMPALTDFFYTPVVLEKAQLLGKKTEPELVREQLKKTVAELSALKEWNNDTLEHAVRELQEKNDWQKGQYFMLIRYCVTGKTATPPLFDTLRVLGKEETLARLQQGLELV